MALWVFKSFACLFSRTILVNVEQTHSSFHGTDQPCRMLPLKFFLWHFLSKMFHVCFFPSTHTVFTTNFPLLVPSHTQFHLLTYSSSLRAGQTTPHIFITYYGEKKKLTFSKRAKSSCKGLCIFENIFFCEVASFLFIVLAIIRIYALSLLVGPPKPFFPVDWFSHQKFLIMSQ